MKQAILLHGTDGSDKDYFWFGDTKQFLESKGYEVWWPQLPNTQKPKLEESLEFVELSMPALDEESIIIAHSSGCNTALSLLENNLITVKVAALVSGFYGVDPDDGGYTAQMYPEEGFDFDRIRTSAHKFVLINSDNDPYGADDKQARPVAEALDAKFILAKGEGHMGSRSFNQPYREFPLLKELLAA